MISSSFGRRVGIQPHRGGWLSMKDGVEDRADVSPRNGSVPVAISYSTTPNENRSVRASNSLPYHLLRRHVGERPHRGARAGQIFRRIDRRGSGFGPARRLRRQFGQTKIQNLGVSARGNEDVSRLDVAMHDALGVGGVQRIGDFDRQAAAASRFPADARRCDAAASFLPETPWR